LQTLRLLLITILVKGLALSSAIAAENWGLCRIPTYAFLTNQPETSVTEIEADNLSRSRDNIMRFYGSVTLKKEKRRIEAAEIIFNESSEQLKASEGVVLTTENIRLSADELSFDQLNDRGELINTRFQLADRHGSGTAGKIEIMDPLRTRLDNILYTACDMEDRDWYFTGRQLELDDDSGIGTARHTTIYFHSVPIFYFPYFQFPIDDRRISGVLTPTFSLSDNDNSHLAVPIYWNIAPNFDTTITPAVYSERGFLYNGEHRYLFRHNQGQVDYLRIDDDIEEQTRWFKKWQHSNSYAASNLSNSLLLQEVSDDDFFADFDRLTPGTDTVNYLDRHYRITHTGENWRSSLLWQDYQTVDSAIAIPSRPYQRLPQLSINSNFKRQQNGLEFNIHNELVKFKRESSISGNRAHLTPTLNWASTDSWYFFQPQIQYMITEYSLENNDPGDNSIHRQVPVTSIDSGLFFERISGPDDRWLQTLEPRLYFAHIPFEEQSEIPDFDTALLGQSYNNFFRANRFSGADRIGDTSQITFGLGTRIYDNDKGDQLLYARMAQIYYAKDRQVSLNNTIDERDRSNIIGQLFIYPSRYLRLSGGVVFDDNTGKYPEKDLSINWARDGAAVNVEYHLIEDSLEQSILSFVYPVNDNWTLIAKYHQSLLFDKPVENIVGLGYESCCWGLKILASQVSDDDFEETDRSLFFELTLKGLTQAGRDVDAHLSSVIPGYQPRF
jgi:LPS-assembly protein